MSTEPIRYDILVQEALRGMVRDLLADVAKKGLPGDHHFFITFNTKAEGVKMSDRLREQYPEEMTVVLQHQFRDLKVTDRAFEVFLSFGGLSERLYIPLTAIKSFADPSVQFQLQFEALALPQGQDNVEPPKDDLKESSPRTKSKPPARRTSVPASPMKESATTGSPDDEPDPPGDRTGAEVVRLDRFRKK